ncbi:MAG: type II toxin-antitoxin system HipA family toxin, partial [Spirochaetaceae bacterium]|nr:type II toxin-antitoxin system HipA family toxin [Spirochaetaceae bacterium]
IFYHSKKVGTLIYKDYFSSFQYDREWLNNGFSISPLSLPLSDKIYTPKDLTFSGLFGIFNDSLPDGWGNLLVERMLLKESKNPNLLNCLDRLAIVGTKGMGALEYYPHNSLSIKTDEVPNLDELKKQCSLILEDKTTDNLDYLFRNGGSSGGARPKIFRTYKNEEWIIKFPSSSDIKEIGLQEYLYSKCAKKCGIQIPNIKLFESTQCPGYFGIQRFDRNKENKIHMASVSALLETSHKFPNLDYSNLLKLTFILTKDVSQVNQMFKLMCFNVFSHNRDDHSKNFTFIYDGNWKLSPAYDLTHSNSLNGEQATTINGNGINPTIKDIIECGTKFGLKNSYCREIAENIKDLVQTDLAIFLK